MGKIIPLLKEKIICSSQDWKRMDKEEALKKECAENKNKPIGKGSKYIWLGIAHANKISKNYFSFTTFKKNKEIKNNE